PPGPGALLFGVLPALDVPDLFECGRHGALHRGAVRRRRIRRPGVREIHGGLIEPPGEHIPEVTAYRIAVITGVDVVDVAEPPDALGGFVAVVAVARV